MSEPMVSHDVVGFYLLSREVAKHVKVVQSGQGADEVFAGYDWYPPMEDASGLGLDAYEGEFFDRPRSEMEEALDPAYLVDRDVSREFVQRHFSRVEARPTCLEARPTCLSRPTCPYGTPGGGPVMGGVGNGSGGPPGNACGRRGPWPHRRAAPGPRPRLAICATFGPSARPMHPTRVLAHCWPITPQRRPRPVRLEREGSPASAIFPAECAHGHFSRVDTDLTMADDAPLAIELNNVRLGEHCPRNRLHHGAE